MATTIQNLHSLTAGNQPGDLMPGEIAYNLADGFVYLGNGTNAFTDTLGQSVGTPSVDGMGWQQAVFNASPVTGSVTLAGFYNAQDNEVTAVTAAGLAAGFTAGAALPAAAAGNSDYYVLVQIGGTLTPPAPTGTADPGDWIVSSGTGWSLVANGSVVIPASNVNITPTGDFTGPTMQDVLNQIQLLYVSQADGTMSQLNCNGDALVYGSTTLGDSDTDTLTVAATSTFNAPITAQGVNCGAVVATNLYSSGNLMVVGGGTIQGNVTLNADATTTTTINGPITAANNLTVAGVTQLNGASQISGALTTSGSVAFAGTAGISITTPISTSGNSGITIGSGSDIGINSTVTFYSNASLVVSGNMTLGQGGFTGKTITYRRPSTVTPGPVNQNLNNFLVVPGTIIAFGGTSAPAGYVPCDGRSLDGSTSGLYYDLYQAIGTTWGGNGAIFNVPDLRGMFLRGTGTNATRKAAAGGSASGPAVGGFSADAFQSHNHTYYRNNAGGYGLTSTGGSAEQQADTGNAGAGETKPVNMGVLYCIKY